MSSEKTYDIPILLRMFSVIELISGKPEGLDFVEIVNTLDIPKTTVYRILHTLEKKAWIKKEGDRYTLGYKLIHYGMVALSRRNIRSVAPTFLQELMVATSETSHLAVLEGKKSLILEVCESISHIKMSSPVGSLLPLHCSAHGKIHLAYSVTEPLEEFLAGVEFEKRTVKTITGVSEMAIELEKIRKQGFALDDREYFDNVRCIAAPVRGKDQKVIGAIGITATTMTFTEEMIPAVAEKLMEIADKFSKEMGKV